MDGRPRTTARLGSPWCHTVAAGDLVSDLGIEDPRATPSRVALVLSAVILMVMTAIGIRSGDAYDGLLRGLIDATACLIGFAVLGQYLALERTRIN